MKYINILLSSLAVLSLISCDKVNEDNRFIELPEFQAQKNVLIEDFTGQKCVNCPKAADAIHKMQHLYGEDHVISVAIHGGDFKIPDALPFGLATATGDAYVAKWGVQSFPSGMIDRIDGLKEYTSWTALVGTRLQVTTPISIEIENDYTESDKTVNSTVTVKSETDYKGTVQVWAVEDDITAMQLMTDGSTNMNYVHNHVFRATLNGLDGTAVNVTKEGTMQSKFTLNITDSRWKVENMSIVAFVFDANGVQQTEIKKIINK